jgi:Cytochrome c7 and related cytochrome c
VPIAACTTCHKDSRKTTYPNAVTIEEEFEQFQKTSSCTYCHTTDIGKKKPPPSHYAAAQ